jgi:hypothetical protein
MLAGAPSGGGTAGIGYLEDHSANPKLRWGATVGLEVPSGVAMTFAGEIGIQRQNVDVLTSPNADTLRIFSGGSQSAKFGIISAGNPVMEFTGSFLSGAAKAYLTVGGNTEAAAGHNLVLYPGAGGSGGGAQAGGTIELRGGFPASGGADGSVRLMLSDGTTIRIQTNGTGIGLFGVTPVAQPADQVAFTDNTGAGSISRTLAGLPDPADTPITADALRDDLVTNTLPVLRNWAASLADGYNDVRANVLRPLGLMA